MEGRVTVGTIAAAIRANIAKLPHDNEQTDFLLYLESLYSMAKLDVYLRIHEKSAQDRRQVLDRIGYRLQSSFLNFNTAWTADKQADNAALAPLISLLQYRAVLVDRTAASPFFRPNTQADSAYLVVASHLAPVVAKHTYDLVVPQAAFADYAAHHLHALYQTPIYLITFLDNGVPVSVPHFLSQLDKRACELNRDSNPLQVLGLDELSDLEKSKILEHSVAAKNYYAAIIQYIHIKNITDLERARAEFKQAVSQHYLPIIPQDDLMRMRLKSRIFAELQSQQAITKFFSKYLMTKHVESFCHEFMDCFTTAETLVIFLSKHVFKTHWRSFIAYFSDQKLAELLPSNIAAHLYQGDMAHDFAAAFILAEEYIRNRARGGETRSYVATSMNYLGSMVGVKAAYTREDKIEAARFLQEKIIEQSTAVNLLASLEMDCSTKDRGALVTGELAKRVVNPLLIKYNLDLKNQSMLTPALDGSQHELAKSRSFSTSSWFGWE